MKCEKLKSANWLAGYTHFETLRINDTKPAKSELAGFKVLRFATGAHAHIEYRPATLS